MRTIKECLICGKELNLRTKPTMGRSRITCSKVCSKKYDKLYHYIIQVREK